MPASPKEIRKARAFLAERKALNVVRPAAFAASAKELNVTFAELLKWIARRYDAGQDESGIRQQLLDQATK